MWVWEGEVTNFFTTHQAFGWIFLLMLLDIPHAGVSNRLILINFMPCCRNPMALIDCNLLGAVSKKSSLLGPKVSKILNRAQYIEKLLGFYGVGVINLH